MMADRDSFLFSFMAWPSLRRLLTVSGGLILLWLAIAWAAALP